MTRPGERTFVAKSRRKSARGRSAGRLQSFTGLCAKESRLLPKAPTDGNQSDCTPARLLRGLTCSDALLFGTSLPAGSKVQSLDRSCQSSYSGTQAGLCPRITSLGCQALVTSVPKPIVRLSKPHMTIDYTSHDCTLLLAWTPNAPELPTQSGRSPRAK